MLKTKANKRKQTPLHKAAFHICYHIGGRHLFTHPYSIRLFFHFEFCLQLILPGNVHVIRFIIENGANVNAKDNYKQALINKATLVTYVLYILSNMETRTSFSGVWTIGSTT